MKNKNIVGEAVTDNVGSNEITALDILMHVNGFQQSHYLTSSYPVITRNPDNSDNGVINISPIFDPADLYDEGEQISLQLENDGQLPF